MLLNLPLIRDCTKDMVGDFIKDVYDLHHAILVLPCGFSFLGCIDGFSGDSMPLCDMFELEFVAFKENGDKEFDIVEFMKDKREIWEGVVQRHRLFRTKMEWITCYSALQTVL
nr:iridoid synthase-like [Ipomoea batatas]GME14766.1 iridoid synthase-like [Ipomoea batatas]